MNDQPTRARAKKRAIAMNQPCSPLFYGHVHQGDVSGGGGAAAAQTARARRPVSPALVLSLVREDYSKRAYFLTGSISEEAYDDDCVFTGGGGF
jgi:hypothetical protein